MNNISKSKLRKMYFNKRMTLDEIGKVYNISHTTLARKMDAYGLKRRNRSEAAYVFYNETECFRINRHSNKLLKNIGPILYWCEGTNYNNKGKRNGTLAFTNTNIDMLKIWIKFLRNICNLNEEKIRVRVYVHKNQNGQRLKRYWSKTLEIPIRNFENVSFTNKDSTKPEYKGTIKIKVHNIKLLDTIRGIIAETVGKILVS